MRTHPQTGSKMKLRNTTSTKRAVGRRIQGFFALSVLSLALFALPGQALASNPCSDATQSQYASPAKQCLAAGLGAGGGGQPAKQVAVPASSSGPSLPFTGLDVAALAIVALALTGTGVVLRRLATDGTAQK
jgi:hypothetical protein